MMKIANRIVPHSIAWSMAFLAVLLVYSSFTGSGDGLLGSGHVSNPLWGWILLLAGGGLIIWMLAAAPRRTEADAEVTHGSD